jgi:hypothetical protein
MAVAAAKTVVLFPADVDDGVDAVRNAGGYRRSWEAKSDALERVEDGLSSGGGGGQNGDLLSGVRQRRPRAAARDGSVHQRSWKRQRGASALGGRGASRELRERENGGIPSTATFTDAHRTPSVSSDGREERSSSPLGRWSWGGVGFWWRGS